MLSSESSAEPGRWRTDRASYQKGIMDAFNEPLIKRIVMMTSAQVGKTEVILNILGYYIENDPSPILLLQPTLEMAQAFSKDRLAPMVRDTLSLKNKMGDTKSRSSGSTMLHKQFPGGHITMAGANSPASLASRPIRILLCDEIDRYPISAGTEGDPVNLAVKRTSTFWNKKIVLVSTPTIKDISRIEAAYEDSTQEVFKLECPSCGSHQQIKRKHLQHTYKDEKLKKVEANCNACGSIHSEVEWKSKPGKWFAQADHYDTRGFHLNEYVSPWRRWLDIEIDFIEAKKSPETLKTFVNTSLGETWEEQGESIEYTGIMARREEYDHPDEVSITTVGIDVQKDRIELEHVGWGEGKESWSLDYIIIPGDTASDEVWSDLHDILIQLRPMAGAIDSGYNTQFVYNFVEKHSYMFSIKGQAGANYTLIEDRRKRGQRLRLARKSGVKPEILGVDQGKAIVYSMLKTQAPGPNYCHFKNNASYDSEYFEQLTGEKLVTRYKMGRPHLIWVAKRARVEALDCRVYALAALELILQQEQKTITDYTTMKINAEAKIPVTPTKARRNTNDFVRSRKGWIR